MNSTSIINNEEEEEEDEEYEEDYKIIPGDPEINEVICYLN